MKVKDAIETLNYFDDAFYILHKEDREKYLEKAKRIKELKDLLKTLSAYEKMWKEHKEEMTLGNVLTVEYLENKYLECRRKKMEEWNEKYGKEINELFAEWEKEKKELDEKYKKRHAEIAARFIAEKDARWKVGLE